MSSYTDHFTANVQYNDWKGTAAADNSDHHSIHDYLTKNTLMTDNEFLLSVSFYSAEGPGFVRIAAFILEDAGKYESAQAALKQHDPIPVRKVDLEMSVDEFLKLFKRFDIVFCHHGLDIQGREFRTKE